MTSDAALHPRAALVGIGRAASGLLITAVLVYFYAVRIAVGDGNPFDYFGYFTNQTSLLTSLVLLATGVLIVGGRRVPVSLTFLRGIATAYLLVVAVIYNLLVPGTGSAPPWVSALLHVVFPLLVALDWLLIGDRPRLPWRRLWMLLPYPILWLTAVLIRGVTDGWVPYGFLLPERGIASLTVHIVGLLAAIIAAGALVWTASRSRGIDLTATST
ncbi:Pr6Pr family membrane protein [Cryobacterium sp. N22]|uniref:Pr6Pr family membrane protein n=1 Tax=Cryobacterium sp. N22 TaxID=2048290 RepID=UPI001E4DEFD4|nr:Pr6Pr family membrane protein [Cryobacterium sp. N22]